jgi:NADPH2:quinone reductase
MSKAPSNSAEPRRRENGSFTGLELQSRISSQGRLILSLVEDNVSDPSDDEVIVRVETASLNPSDIGLLFGPADIGPAIAGGTTARPTLTPPVPAAAISMRRGHG